MALVPHDPVVEDKDSLRHPSGFSLLRRDSTNINDVDSLLEIEEDLEVLETSTTDAPGFDAVHQKHETHYWVGSLSSSPEQGEQPQNRNTIVTAIGEANSTSSAWIVKEKRRCSLASGQKSFFLKLPMPHLKTGKKRKADDSADKQVSVKKAKVPDQSDEQRREMRYAKEQVEAYREGKQSNKRKKCLNLVKDKIESEKSDRENERILAAKKRHKLEAESKLMTIGCRTEEGCSGGVEDVGSNRSTPVYHEQDADDESLSKALCRMEDESVDNEHRHLIGLHDGDAYHSKKQSSSDTKVQAQLRSYEESLSELPRDLPTQEQVDRLARVSESGPNFLGRTAATIRGLEYGHYRRKTNGFTSYDVFLPAADSRKEENRSHDHITDLSRAELVYMIGNHLIWKDLVEDEFLSYSKDPLFLVVHALSRYHQNQGDVTIQFLDRRRAKAPNGDMANFYTALDLYTIFEIPKWSGWGSIDNTKLHPRKFTQEYLSHGPVLTPETTFQQARIEDLIDDGLYEIFPEFAAPEDHKRAGLYTLQVVYRKIGYPPVVDVDQTSTSGRRRSSRKKATGPIYSYENCSQETAMTVELLTTVRRVTLNFIQRPETSDEAYSEPPLHAFICFLTFEKRQKKDPVFIEWIQKHYKAQDVKDLYADSEGHPLPNMTVVADHLPGYMQYLDLIRDCIELFSLEPLPPNEVETKHAFDGLTNQSFTYATFDHSHHRKDVKSKKYDAASKKNKKTTQRSIGYQASDEASKALYAPRNSQLEATGQERDARQSSVEDEEVVVAKSGLLRGITEE